MKKNEFKLNENVELTIYNYDDNGTEYTKIVSGKICQLTENLIVIDRGKYKECFRYSELYPQKYKEVKGEPYDLSINTYKEDIIVQCLYELKKKGKGFVFTKKQLDKVLNRVSNGRYTTRKGKGIYIIEKI